MNLVFALIELLPPFIFSKAGMRLTRDKSCVMLNGSAALEADPFILGQLECLAFADAPHSSACSGYGMACGCCAKSLFHGNAVMRQVIDREASDR